MLANNGKSCEGMCVCMSACVRYWTGVYQHYYNWGTHLQLPYSLDQTPRLLKVSRMCPEVTNWVIKDRCQFLLANCICVQLDCFLLLVSQGIV